MNFHFQLMAYPSTLADLIEGLNFGDNNRLQQELGLLVHLQSRECRALQACQNTHGFLPLGTCYCLEVTNRLTFIALCINGLYITINHIRRSRSPRPPHE